MKKLSEIVPVFESALVEFNRIKAEMGRRIGDRNKRIAELRAEIKAATADLDAELAALAAELSSYVERWADENEGSYFGENGKIRIVRAHYRRHWNVQVLDEILDKNPELAARLVGAYDPDEIEMRFSFER